MERAAAGEEIVISKADKLMVKLVPYAMSAPPRTGGFLSGKIWESPAPWEPDEELIYLSDDDGPPLHRVARGKHR